VQGVNDDKSVFRYTDFPFRQHNAWIDDECSELIDRIHNVNFSAFRTQTERNGDYVNSVWRQTCNWESDGKGLIGIGYYQDQI